MTPKKSGSEKKRKMLCFKKGCQIRAQKLSPRLDGLPPPCKRRPLLRRSRRCLPSCSSPPGACSETGVRTRKKGVGVYREGQSHKRTVHFCAMERLGRGVFFTCFSTEVLFDYKFVLLFGGTYKQQIPGEFARGRRGPNILPPRAGDSIRDKR